jgi:hypothetical protein
MSQHNLAILVVLTLIAMVLVTFWRKVLLLLISVIIAVFVFGLVHAAAFV